jgi:hypothetical protein
VVIARDPAAVYQPLPGGQMTALVHQVSPADLGEAVLWSAVLLLLLVDIVLQLWRQR